MGPRLNLWWELWSLAFWWAAWTLADTYLIPYTPAPELIVISVCVTSAAVVRVRSWRDASLPKPTPLKEADAV